MIDFRPDQLSALLSGVAVFGGMLHKIAGPSVDRLAVLIFEIVVNLVEQKHMSQTQGMRNPTNLPQSANIGTIATEGVVAALEGAASINTAVAGQANEAGKIEAGISSFLNFAVPIVSAVDPAYADLFTGIGAGLGTILQAVAAHQAATASKSPRDAA